jgi:hypothetical protein
MSGSFVKLRPKSRPAPPRILEPFLVHWERLDRRRRRIRMIRRGGVAGIEFTRHRGTPLRLRDGTLVNTGDLIGEFHLDNALIKELLPVQGHAAILHIARDDLRILARWARQVSPERRPVGYHGESILVPYARRMGMEVYPRRSTAWTRLQDWYLRGVMARWAAEGRGRLRHGRRGLRAGVAWMSAACLDSMYGGPAGDSF